MYFQFFFLECYGSNNQPLGTEQIYEQLNNIMNQSNEPDAPVGLLTTENRNKWAKAYELLAKGMHGWGDSSWLSANSWKGGVTLICYNNDAGGWYMYKYIYQEVQKVLALFLS